MLPSASLALLASLLFKHSGSSHSLELSNISSTTCGNPVNRAQPLVPDTLQFNEHGQACSALFGGRFYRGGRERSDAVTHFVRASQLPERWQRAGQWQILELGFGLGLNFLETLTAWRTRSEQKTNNEATVDRLHYTAVENHPLSASDMRTALSSLRFEPALIESMLSQWPDLIAGFHRLSMPGSVELTLVFGHPIQAVPELTGKPDAIYLNRLAHGGDSSFWHPPVIRAAIGLAQSGCQLVGTVPLEIVSPALRSAGVTMRKTGFAWAAQANSRLGVAQRAQIVGKKLNPSVTVVGAGIAGIAIARQLALAGWSVEVLDAETQAFSNGSAQPILAGHMHVSPDDNYLARLTRSAQSLQAELPGSSVLGRLTLASSQADAITQQATMKRLSLPEHLLRWVSAAEASELAGIAVSGGLWQGSSRILRPQGLLTSLPSSVRLRFQTPVATISRIDGLWHLSDLNGKLVSATPTVVLCTGALASALLTVPSITTRAVSGQSTRLTGSLARQLQCVLGGSAYACPMGDGSVLTGASYREPLAENGSLTPKHQASISAADEQLNRQRWRDLALSAQSQSGNKDEQILANYVGTRHTTADHLPLIGSVPDHNQVQQAWSEIHRDDRLPIPTLPGIFLAAGFGSRGALWSALAAKLIADALLAGPLPIEKSLADAIAPQRFLRRAIRRNRTP